VLAFVVLMILPPAATAASGADPSNPSLDQYVESVPTSHGGPPPSHGSIRDGSTSQRGHLPASVRHRLAASGGSDAKQLEAIATSPSFGAPTTSSAPRSGGTKDGGSGTGGGTGARQPGGSGPSGLDAFTTAATHGGGSSVAVLLAGLVLITLLAGGTALARRRADIA
jgi:hypothetical protein